MVIESELAGTGVGRKMTTTLTSDTAFVPLSSTIKHLRWKCYIPVNTLNAHSENGMHLLKYKITQPCCFCPKVSFIVFLP